MQSTWKAVEFYVSKGFEVLPVWGITFEGDIAVCGCGHKECRTGGEREKNVGKHPVTYCRGCPVATRGVKDATSDLELLRQWWALAGWNLNIGLATTRVFVLDIDDEDARFELAELPDTVEVISGSGSGEHIYFLQPDDFNVSNAVGKELPRGIDVRGCGPSGEPHGYVLAPPSMHASGQRYEFEVSSHMKNVEIAPAPSWLLDMLKRANENEIAVTISNIDAPDLAVFDISKITKDRILNGHQDGEDRSECDFKVMIALVEAGATPSEVAAIFNKYPIGTSGKMASHTAPESYLQRSIGNAFNWTTQKSERKTIPSKVQPAEMVTKDEADNEDRALSAAYMQGWSDALQANPSIVPTMWPRYLELKPQTYEEYGIGCNFEYADHGDPDHLSAALVVPYYDGGDVATLDMTIYSPPENYPDRIWKTESGLSVFDVEFMRSNPVSGSVVVVGDFDEALFLREIGLNGYDILAQASDGQLGGPRKRVQALARIVGNAERIVLVWPRDRRAEGKALARSLEAGGQRVSWASMPASLRKMLTTYKMGPEECRRILDMATTVLV